MGSGLAKRVSILGVCFCLSLTLLVTPLGCSASTTCTVDNGAVAGGQGHSSGAQAPPETDWESLLEGLPNPGLEPTQFYYYTAAVLDALRAFYAGDSRISVTSISPPEDEEGYFFECVWGSFADEGSRFRDPLTGTASVDVRFSLIPANEQGPSLAKYVCGKEHIRWTSDSQRQAVLDALERMWEPMLRGYSALGDNFWEAFATLHRLAMMGYLNGAGGEFQLPGPAAYNCSLMFLPRCADGDCSAAVSVELEPEGDFPPKPESWQTLLSKLPQPGFGSALTALSESMVAAVRQAWATEPAVTVAWTGRSGSSTENWQETTFSWLRFPLSADDPGYLLETLTLHLTPRAEAETGPLATAVTVTELVAWDTRRRGDQPSFTALAPVRDFFLNSYLCPGDDFWQTFGQLELAPGLTEVLSAANGARIQVAVEEVSDEGGAVRTRYSLTYPAYPTGG